MSAIRHDQDMLQAFMGIQSFSFYEQPQIEIPAPVKWEYAQKYRQFQLRDVGPDWFQWNHYWAHRFYLSKREWWQTVV